MSKNAGGVDNIAANLTDFSTPLNTAKDQLTDLIRGHQDVDVAGSGAYTLSVTDGDPEARVPVVRLTGTLTGARTVKIPATGAGRVFVIHNDTAGSYAVTVTTDQGGSTGVSVPQGYAQHVFHNGTNVIPAAPAIKASYSTLHDNLVAFYKMDEPAGMRLDSYGSNHLTDNNTVTQAVGKVGAAAQFTAANSEYLSAADSAALSTGDVDFTFCVWVYADSFGSTRIILAKSNGATSGEFFLGYNSAANRFRFAIENGATFVTVDANVLGAPSTATWYFIVAWYDTTANTVNIQVNNGTANSAATGATVPADTAVAFTVGSTSVPDLYWDGRVDGLGFWKRVLTAAERTELYNGGAGKPYPF
jgi:hypothetical protein